MVDIDWAQIGFRCGLEIHQQLATRKLFCGCRTDARAFDDDHPDFRLVRWLRPTQSELGEVDAAALAEARRNKRFEYRGAHGYACLVDADEEPPHPGNEAALDAALTMALLLDSQLLEEIEWMRKIVIDGSNTAGFQRTALVAVGGRVDGVGIQTLCLEEDSARKILDEPDRVVYGLDRLGIPLIEIATAPELRDGAHARQIAARIGAILRSTGLVQRGLGTIRQDLNVSVAEGTRIEVKGVQDLASIPRVIEYEARRQLRLVEVRKELAQRGITPAKLALKPHDLSGLLSKSASKVLQPALREGGVVLGLRLAGFQGLIGSPAKDAPRLGRELATYARREAGVQGLLHGDELPAMGVTPSEVDVVRRALECGPQDSFVLVADRREKAEAALRVTRDRAEQALRGVPPEVRMAEADGSTTFMRPMPGAARMYPETDVPPQRVFPGRVERIRKTLPPPPERVVSDLQSQYRISKDEAEQLVADGNVEGFRVVASRETGPLAARAVLSYWPELDRKYPGAAEGLAVWTKEALGAVQRGAFAKEGLLDVLTALCSGRAKRIEEAVRQLGLGGLDASQVVARARALVEERADFVRTRGLESVGPLMGILMQEFRGKVDGGVISATLRNEVERFLAAPTATKR